MIGVSSDSISSYNNFMVGYWFENKVVDCKIN